MNRLRTIILASVSGIMLLIATGVVVHKWTRTSDFETKWGDLASVHLCRNALEQMPPNLRKLSGTECVKVRGHALLVATIELVIRGETVPVRIILPQDPAPIRKFIVEVIGGPGEVLLQRPGIESWAEDGRETIENCNAAVLSPAYSGTWHRSSYPGPSERRAALEVDGLLATIGNGSDVSIVAQSLGGRIVSRPEVQIPSGRHLLIVPMLWPARQTVGWMVNGKDPERPVRQALVTNFLLGPEGYRSPKPTRNVDFARAFFERGQDDWYATSIDFWKRKPHANPTASITAVIAKAEERAGGLEFAPQLRKLGWAIYPVEGKHIARSGSEEAERAAIAGEFLKSVCSIGR